jgi:hypothetical protein
MTGALAGGNVYEIDVTNIKYYKSVHARSITVQPELKIKIGYVNLTTSIADVDPSLRESHTYSRYCDRCGLWPAIAGN